MCTGQHSLLHPQSVSSCKEQQGNLFTIYIKMPELALEAFWLGNTVLVFLEYLKHHYRLAHQTTLASTTMQMLQQLLLLQIPQH